MKDFDPIYLSHQNGPSLKGKFKVSEVGLGWKSQDGEIITISKSDLLDLEYVRVARDYQLRITKKNQSILTFDGFSIDQIHSLTPLMNQYYSVTLSELVTSTKGYNWGSLAISNSLMTFENQEKVVFDIPFSQIMNVTSTKQEVGLEFLVPKHRGDQLVELKMYVPGVATIGTTNEDGYVMKEKSELSADGEIRNGDMEPVINEQGETLTKAQVVMNTLKMKSSMDQQVSELVCGFEEVLCLTPRGRFRIDMHKDFFRLRGKSHDYKILYSAITRLVQVPKDDIHDQFVVGVHPPLRQGQTKYPFLVFQIAKDEDVEIKLENVTADMKTRGVKEEYDGGMSEILHEVFTGMTNKRCLEPSDEYLTTTGQKGLKCAQKANECYLYPLDKALLAISKPPLYIPFVEIASVVFSRVTTGTTKTIEMKVNLTTGELAFSSIPREEHERLDMFLRSKKLKVVNEVEEGVPTQVFNTMFGEGEESEDDDFVAGSESDVNEEFNEDYDSEGGGSGGEGQGSDDGSAGEEDEQQDRPMVVEKPKKEKKRKDTSAEGPKKRQKKEKKEGPKRPMSSFLYFSQEMRSKLKQENPSATIGEIGKMLGELWKTAEKGKFEEMAARDKDRYARELEEFKRTGVLPGGNSAGNSVSAPKPSGVKVKKEIKSEEFVEEDDDF